MKLLTVGDSFTYGEELENRSLAWPYLIANKSGWIVTNLAKPGKSKDFILRQVVENIHDYDIVIIAWSHFARFEYSDEWGVYDIWPGSLGNLFDGEVAYRKDIIDYVTKHHDDQYLYTQYLLDIILLQNYLKVNDKKYIMLDAFGNTKPNVRNLNTELAKQIDPTYYLGWPNQSMMEWTYGAPQGTGGHFLEEGHKIVAEKIYEYIRHLGWIS